MNQTRWFFTKKRRADRFQVDGVPVAQGITHALRAPQQTTLQALHAAEGLYAWYVVDHADGRMYLHGFDATEALLKYVQEIGFYLTRPKTDDETYTRLALKAVTIADQINTTRDRTNSTPAKIHQIALCAKQALKSYNDTLESPAVLPDFDEILSSTLFDHMIKSTNT